MKEFISIPTLWLTPTIINDQAYLRAVIYLAQKINEYGSVDFSSGMANTMFGISPRRYRTLMSIIANDKYTDKHTTNKTTSVSYNCQVVVKLSRQAKGQTNDKLPDKRESPKFTPPTEMQVADFVVAKGYHFDPAQFVTFYQSKGWMVGANPMKDWTAACRTWELEWKKKYGELFYYQINKQTNADQAGRYARLREATATILRQPGNIDPYFNDSGRNP